MSSTAKRLNDLAKINNTKSYLEIGVQRGLTFNSVNSNFKVGVDPKFGFEYTFLENNNTRFYEIPSDEFFSSQMHNQKFDLILLDGLHTFEQTLRDFCASLSRSHEKTIWLIDDVLPPYFLASLRSVSLSVHLQRLMRYETNFWMGDVFKVILSIHDLFPQFSFATYEGHGQTVVYNSARTNFSPRFKSLSAIANINYFVFKRKYLDVLNIRDSDYILENLNSTFHP